jgi:hypothetical protein
VTWQTVFDVRDHFAGQASLLYLLWLPVLSYIFWRPPQRLKRHLDNAAYGKRAIDGVKYGFPILFVLSLGKIEIEQYDDWLLDGRMRSGDFAVVEGRVENFLPRRFSDDRQESFDVSGVHFIYPRPGGGQYFNQVHYQGGPIAGGEYVRIVHIGNDILRLEIAKP